MSTLNSSSPAEFTTLLLPLGFAQSVVDFLSNEQGIKMVDDMKLIPVTQMTPTYTTPNSVVAAYNIRNILLENLSNYIQPPSGGLTADARSKRD
jgi:hypothetical protein